MVELSNKGFKAAMITKFQQEIANFLKQIKKKFKSQQRHRSNKNKKEIIKLKYTITEKKKKQPSLGLFNSSTEMTWYS